MATVVAGADDGGESEVLGGEPSCGSPCSSFASSACAFPLVVSINVGSWGPDTANAKTLQSCLRSIQKYPFEPSLKPDRLGKVCDFTFSSFQRNQRDQAALAGGGAYGGPGRSSGPGAYNVPPGLEEEMKFHTVDTRPLPKTRSGLARYHHGAGRRNPKQSTQVFQQKQQLEKDDRLGRQKRAAQKKQQAAQQARFQRIYNRHRTFAEWSIQPTPKWSVEAEITQSQLHKQTIDYTKIHVEDITWRGTLRYYNKQMDRVTPKQNCALEQLCSSLDFYWVSTQDDDLLKQMILNCPSPTDAAPAGATNTQGQQQELKATTNETASSSTPTAAATTTTPTAKDLNNSAPSSASNGSSSNSSDTDSSSGTATTTAMNNSTTSTTAGSTTPNAANTTTTTTTASKGGNSTNTPSTRGASSSPPSTGSSSGQPKATAATSSSSSIWNAPDAIYVAATDQILACLMAAHQAKYSWHLNITKAERQLVLDKADGSIVDLLTVNETAPEPPMQDDANKPNRPPALGFEAVKINQNIRQQLLVRGSDASVAKKYEEAPFVEPGDNPAAIAYRYRKFYLPGRPTGTPTAKAPIIVLTRAEVHAVLPPSAMAPSSSPGGPSSSPSPAASDSNVSPYMTICAINEFELRAHHNWSKQLETQKGALLATEIRNNTNKFQKWVASALIAGCDHLRLGYVTRKTPTSSDHHTLLCVQSHMTKELGGQIGLKPDNAWGIVRAMAELFADREDGRYVLLKDPMKPVMRLYKRPLEDDEDEGDGGGGGGMMADVANTGLTANTASPSSVAATTSTTAASADLPANTAPDTAQAK